MSHTVNFSFTIMTLNPRFYKLVGTTYCLIIRVTKSKEVEADNVVLVNFKNDKLGFPNQIADDKVLNFVFTQDENYMFAEERRAQCTK